MNRRASSILLLCTLLACHDDDGRSTRIGFRSIADLDGDGFADLVIGAPLHDGGGLAGSARGAVFIHLGSATGPSPAPDLTIFGTEDGAEFGSSIAFVGDPNRGGAPDLLVGAPFDDGDADTLDDGSDRGRAFLFFGGASMDSVPDVTITGAEAGSRLGWSVGWVGDLDLNGFDDWIVGAPGDDGDDNSTEDGHDRGRAFLFSGGFFPDGVPDLTLTGAEDGAEFGFSVGSPGDWNDGGALDVAVGAPGDDADDDSTEDGRDRGRVFVFYGGGALDDVADVVLSGDEDGAEFGTALAPVFDVDGDGIDDLLVGAPLHDAGAGAAADRGEAYLFFGASAPDAVPDLILSGGTDGGAFGASLDRAGDQDGDGERDFVVGAPLEDPGARADAGSVYLFLGGAVLDATPDLILDGSEAGARFGAAVSGTGDLDGDGRDLVVAAPFDDADGNASDEGLDRGRSFVFSGGTSPLDPVPDASVPGSQDGALAGTGLAR